jgi:hypothetical protein
MARISSATRSAWFLADGSCGARRTAAKAGTRSPRPRIRRSRTIPTTKSIEKHAYDLVYRHGLAVDDSVKRLALGSTTGGL